MDREEFRKRFQRWKKGERVYDRGTIIPLYKIGHNVSNAELNDDGTFTDDYTKIFDDVYVTPKKLEIKRNSHTWNNWDYYNKHRSDWTKTFMSSGTNEKGLELTHPEFDLLLGGRLLATELLPLKTLTKSNNRHLLDSAVDDKWIPVPDDKTGRYAISNVMMPRPRPYTDEGEAAIESLINFYNSPQYKIRALTSKNTDSQYDINVFNNMKKMFMNNINNAKYADDMPYIIRRDVNSPTGWVYSKTALGQNTPDTNLVQIKRTDLADLYEVYLHELIHQSNNRTGGKIVEGYNLPLIAKSLTKSEYLDIPDELRARVLTGLIDMMKKGLDINDTRAILSYLGNDIETLPLGVQQLIDNFDYNDVLKSFLYMLSAGPIGFGIYNKNSTNGISLYKDGKSPIHIKPANRGKFTALKKRTGHSASWFKLNGTPAQKKMATFALNAKKWKH